MTWNNLQRSARIAFLLAISGCYLGVGLLGLVRIMPGQQTLSLEDNRTLATEHRVTALETTVAILTNDLHDMRNYSWLELIGIAGLSGEAGVRLVARKNKPGGE